MAKKKRSKLKIFLVLLVLGGAIGGGVWYQFYRKKEIILTIQTEKAGRRNITEVVVANGKIQPVVMVKISPEVSGEIIDLPVKEGQAVQKGEVLVKIKPDIYVAYHRSAEANYQAALANKSLAKAGLDKAQAEFKRFEELLTNKLVSESNFLGGKTDLEVARANFKAVEHQVDVAKASLDRAKEDLAKTTIFSPLTGTVSKLNSQLGERVVGTAMMTGTEMMIIADLTEMEARVDIGEIDVVLISPGQKARLEIDAFRERKFTGIVTEIANSSKGPLSGSMSGPSSQNQEATKFEVKIRVQEKEVFRPGMSVTAEVETRSRTNVLAVPIQSVTTRLPKGTNQPSVVANGTTNTNDTTGTVTNVVAQNGTNGANGTNDQKQAKKNEPPKPKEVVFIFQADAVKMVPVKRGISDDSYVEILEGLDEGQEVVSGGYKAISRDLQDGAKVRKGDPEKEAKDKEKT